jgi:hypothetical protein
MPNVEFGSRKAANRFRDRVVAAHLTESDDRRSTTVRISSSAPASIVQRAEEMAFETQSPQEQASRQADLAKSERESLKRQHSTFNWQEHGFEAMRVKGAMQARGVDTWQDYYEPGEGAASAISKLNRKKAKTGQSGQRASLGIEGMRTDLEEQAGGGRQRRQAEQVRAEGTRQAKRPAIVEGDRDAQEHLREEQQFTDELWDITFRDTDDDGRPEPSGPDFRLLEERHDERSIEAQIADEHKSAPKTRDPIEWARQPNEVDFPGIDTVTADDRGPLDLF